MPPITLQYREARNRWCEVMDTVGRGDRDIMLERHELFEGVRLLMIGDPRPATNMVRIARQGGGVTVQWA